MGVDVDEAAPALTDATPARFSRWLCFVARCGARSASSFVRSYDFDGGGKSSTTFQRQRYSTEFFKSYCQTPFQACGRHALSVFRAFSFPFFILFRVSVVLTAEPSVRSTRLQSAVVFCRKSSFLRMRAQSAGRGLRLSVQRSSPQAFSTPVS